MKLTLESTTKIVHLRPAELDASEATVEARIWEGFTERGVRVVAFVALVAVRDTDDSSQFEEELQHRRPPSPDVDLLIPHRLVL
jgi:hypothetical protein